jgi:integrase
MRVKDLCDVRGAAPFAVGLGQVVRPASEGRKPGKPPSRFDLDNAWRRICKFAKLKNARLHDFQHTVGTYGGKVGFNAFLVRDLLGHKTLAMTGRYVEKDADPLKRAADVVANRIAAATAGKQADLVNSQPSFGSHLSKVLRFYNTL